ncbi:MAG: AAA family ATPase [Candidatus Thermoplasmatota archaeon]|nr:AAA family ATPase [Euryarchaeota archaeon]MBU4033042.1 AAA family ATPase [Candidatus Thermoplasmatota archaeon]MBU4070687.1 AAA family ATPase [Candidatus Thermoplasmatota archaeon]MBU4143703.1 AAA family ATPase [Candidatus Thermoplasmatota archaeon]MBU4591783.1 AAA family ATPase [Candidatus Thermoplasmatota archaeon]
MRKMKTHIDGFDEILDGGIPEGHVVLICGTPGTMKTSVTYSIMYENAKREGYKGLYISLEESYEGLKGAMLDLKMSDIDKLPVFMIDVGKIRKAHPEQEVSKGWLKILEKYLKKRVEDDDFDIVVIDSLAALYSLTELSNPRADLFHFIRFLKELGPTVFLISEISHGSTKLVANDEDFLADGIIHLMMHEAGDSDIQLRINCIKMRRTKHQRGWFRLMHGDSGFMVTPIISD